MQKSYFEHVFTGLSSFTEVLDRTLVSYRLLSETAADQLFTCERPVLDREKDIVELGNCTSGGKTLFFMDCGVGITEKTRSHVVFLYDHEPSPEELLASGRDMDELAAERLKKVREKK